MERLNQLSGVVVGAAIEVHRQLGPGFLETVYESALAVELDLRGVRYLRQALIAVSYKGNMVGEGRLDLLVENCLIVELKAVDALTNLHQAQLMSYLKATGHRLGLLINFNVPVLKQGVRRVVYGKDTENDTQ